MSQHDYNLADALGAVFRADANDLFAAIKSRNSGTTAPSDPIQGMVYVNPVDATTHEVYEYDGANWILKYVINPTSHEFRSVDGLRRTYGGTAGGTADALTISTTPAISAYESGQLFGVYTGAGANTGAMTLNVDGVGAVSLKINGSDPAAGDVPANSMLLVRIRTTGGNIGHIIGGALPRATTARYGNVLFGNEPAFLAGTAGLAPRNEDVRKHVRERLYANRTYYVRADGSDSNTGLVNNSGGAFATRQKAWNTIQDTLDLNGYVVTVQIADSTAYTDSAACYGFCVGQKDASSIVFQGNSGTPANVTITTTAANCFSAEFGAQFTVKDMKLVTVTSGDCLRAANYGSQIRFSNVNFAACADNQISAILGGLMAAIGDYTISGNADRHVLTQNQATAFIVGGITITLSGTPAFGNEFAKADFLSAIMAGSLTFSGSATGKRYESEKNSLVYTGGGGATYLPGNSSGSTADGGLYL